MSTFWDAFKRLQKPLQWLTVVVIFAFIGQRLHQDWHQLSQYKFQFQYSLLLLSFLVLLCRLFSLALGWKLILQKSSGYSLSYLRANRIWFLSQLGKYAPGKVWMVLGRIYLSQKESISKRVSSVSIVIEMILSVISSTIIFLLSLVLKSKAKFENDILFSSLIVVAGVIALHPNLLKKFSNFFLVRLKREPLELEIRYHEILLLLTYYLAMWAFFGLAFYLFINSITSVPISKLLIMTGIFAVSWIIGFLALFAPGGLGVREGILAFFLSFYFPASVAIMLSLLSRLWITAAEISGIGISLILSKTLIERKRALR